jgi:hypothetical protein
MVLARIDWRVCAVLLPLVTLGGCGNDAKIEVDVLGELKSQSKPALCQATLDIRNLSEGDLTAFTLSFGYQRLPGGVVGDLVAVDLPLIAAGQSKRVEIPILDEECSRISLLRSPTPTKCVTEKDDDCRSTVVLYHDGQLDTE